MHDQAWAVLTAGVVSAFVAVVFGQLSDRSGRRAEWWRRTEWAANYAAMTEDERREVGIRVLELQTESRLVPKKERDLAIAAYEALVPVSTSAFMDEEGEADG